MWIANAEKIPSGSWCVRCLKSERSWETMQGFVASKGGKILSARSEYRNGSSKLAWACANGHRWVSTAGSVQKEQWCRKCHALTRRISLETLSEYARSRGGQLVSSSHPERGSYYAWSCAKGHSWNAKSNIMALKQWCKRCAYDDLKYSIEDMKRLAQKRGGECLSNSYGTLSDKLRWRCKKGHEWETMPKVILKGSWCEKCTSPKLNSIEKLRALVEAKGGKCITQKYVGCRELMDFRCAKGHRWRTTSMSIQSGHWCHVCTKTKDGSIEEMQRLAKKRGGGCLSAEYKNNHTKLLWVCLKKHEFWMKPNQIKARGSWCPTCRGKVRRTLADIQKMAEARGGRCLSTSFSKNADKVELECNQGHRWKTIAAGFIHGTWCPICARTSAKNRRSGRHGAADQRPAP